MEDFEVMLKALSMERDNLHEQIMQVDRVIAKVKAGQYLTSNQITTLEIIPSNIKEPVSFNNSSNIKVQVIKIFDLIGCAAKLREINTEYTRQTGKVFNLREPVRSLHNTRMVLMIKEKSLERAKYWVKTDWVENGVLLDKYKFDGFDLIYKAGDIEFV